MSFTDRLVLWLHIGFVIFTIGPLALAISSTPRYLRRQELAVARYLARITLIFTIISVGVLILGAWVAQQHKGDFGSPWLTVAMTLFVVSLVLLALIIRDQRKAITVLEASGVPASPSEDARTEPAADGPEPEAVVTGTAAGDAAEPATAARGPRSALASVERGRIAVMGGVVNLIWLVILILMVWNAGLKHG